MMRNHIKPPPTRPSHHRGFWGLRFLSFLAFAQVARAAVFGRARDPGAYATVDSTNIWAVAAVLLAAACLAPSGVLDKLRGQSRTPLRWYAFYLGFCGISIFWGGRIPYSGFRVLESAVNLLLVVRVMELLGDRQGALKYLVWAAGGSTLLGLLGIWRECGLGFWFHHNLVPFAGAVGSLLCIASWAGGVLPWRSVVVPAAPCLVALVGGTSGGSNVAFAIGLATFGLLAAWRAKSAFRQVVFGILLIGCCTIGFVWKDAAKEFLFPNKTEESIETATGRTEVWADYYAMFKQSPLFGRGFPMGDKEVTVGDRAGSGTNETSHNMVVSVLVNTGCTGLALFFAWLGTCLLWFFRDLRKPATQAESMVLLPCLITACINSLTMPILGSHWFWPVMIVYGIMAYQAVYLSGRRGEAWFWRRHPSRNQRRVEAVRGRSSGTCEPALDGSTRAEAPGARSPLPGQRGRPGRGGWNGRRRPAPAANSEQAPPGTTAAV